MKLLLNILLVLTFSSCNGQNATKKLGDRESTAEVLNDKIIRTQGVSSGVVKTEIIDNVGNIWFSISGEGAYRYNGKTFENFTTADGLPSNRVESIIQLSSGMILFGSDKGISSYDGEKFSQFPIPDTLAITIMLEDKDRNLWFGTKTDGIFNYAGKTLKNFLNKGQGFYPGDRPQLILDILQDKSGNIWFSSWNGGGVWRYDGKEFKNFIPPPEYYRTNQDRRDFSYTSSLSELYTSSPNHITDDMIFSMMEDKEGNIWFATRDHGACRFDGKSFSTIGRSDGLNCRGVYSIIQDRNGDFWFSTEDNGVWLYNGSSFINYSEKNGLVSNAVLNILEDSQGNLWFGTKWFGLSRFDSQLFTTFSKQ